MMRAHRRTRGLVRTYGVPGASEGSPPTERLQSENPQLLFDARRCSCAESKLAFLTYLFFVRLRFVKVPLAALSRKPETLSHVKAASMTLPWLCAWITVDTLANVKKGDNVIIIGALGSVLSHVLRRYIHIRSRYSRVYRCSRWYWFRCSTTLQRPRCSHIRHLYFPRQRGSTTVPDAHRAHVQHGHSRCGLKRRSSKQD